MKIIVYLIFLFFSFLFINCIQDKKKKNGYLQELLGLQYYDKYAYFSYPGRYEPIDKKREVTEEILKLIRNTQFSLDIYAYSFDNPEIIQELIAAKNRGVRIHFTGDSKEDYEVLKKNDIIVNIWKKDGIHHIKAILSDGDIFFTGTGNFSEYGPTRDWNGYIKIRIPSGKGIEFKNFLEENSNVPYFDAGGIIFLNSPGEGLAIQEILLREIENAKTSIHYLIFDHFDPIISHALKKASSRGVEVTGVYNNPLDAEGRYLSENFYGLLSGIYIDGNEEKIETSEYPKGGLLHHKTIIIDKKVLLSGSYNYSESARDSNRELFYKTEDFYLVSEFEKEFERVKEKSYRKEFTNFYFAVNNTQSSVNRATEKKICFDKPLQSGILEAGDGIFKSYLYFTRYYGNCIYMDGQESISSGFSSYGKANYYSLYPFIKNMSYHFRTSNKVYTSGSETILNSSKEFIPVKADYVYFTGSSVYFKLPEYAKGDRVVLWSPGEEAASTQNISYRKEGNYFQADFILTSLQKRDGILFLENSSAVYSFCYRAYDKSSDRGIEYLMKKMQVFGRIYWNRNSEPGACAVIK